MVRCIVIDMDETLIHSYLEELDQDGDKNYSLAIDMLSDRNFNSKDMLYWVQGDIDVVGVFRPGVHEFLQYCSENFDYVVIWSAGEKEYVKSVIDHLYIYIDKPDIVWARNMCKVETKYLGDKKYKMYTKPLQKVADKLNIDKDSIIFVDDRLDYVEDGDGLNHFHIKPFKPEPSEIDDLNDIELNKIMDELNSIEFRNVIKITDYDIKYTYY